MASVVAKYFYNEIEYLAGKIGELGLTEALVMTAKSQDLEKMKKLSDEFYAQYPEIHEKLLELYLDYDNEDSPEVFRGNAKYDWYNTQLKEYDKEKIKIIDLICLCALSDEKMSPDDMFLEQDVLYEALEEEGYGQLVGHIKVKYLDSLESLLEAFKEK